MGKKIAFLASFLFLVATACAIYGYGMLFGKKISLGETEKLVLISPDDTYSSVFSKVTDSLGIEDVRVLDWIAKKKSYPSHIKAGRFLFTGEMSYVGLIDKLRSGDQEPVNVTFNNIRTLNDLAGKVGGQIEADSAEIMGFLLDPANYSGDGFTKETVIAVFIPNTYQLFWNTDANGFYVRMLSEYHKFWNEARLSKADEIGLTPVEVATLASIIDDEVVKADEKPRIAGVYLNRLDKGMLLQACPTIKFALNDFTITRVLNKHLTVESPYNTYKYQGLPPGPIGCPTIGGIDAVLNAEKHDYIFFAAKADFSGYHNFSRTLREHNNWANQYQQELDRRKIFN